MSFRDGARSGTSAQEYATYGTLYADRDVSGAPQDSAQHYFGSPRDSMPQSEGVHRYGEHSDLQQIVPREDNPRRNQSAPGWVEDTDTPNVFVEGDNERATLKSLALAAFGGKNRPVMPDPGHTAETVMDCSSLTFVNAAEVSCMYKKAFPTLFFRGIGGPSHARTNQVPEKELIKHLLRLYHRRFASNAQFVYCIYCMIQRRSVNGVTSTVSESAALQEVFSRLFCDIEGGATP